MARNNRIILKFVGSSMANEYVELTEPLTAKDAAAVIAAVKGAIPKRKAAVPAQKKTASRTGD